MTRLSRRLLMASATAVAIGLGAVLMSVQPAGAHGLGGLQPTNYESRVVRARPAVPGLTVRVVALGEHIEVVNRTGRDIEDVTGGELRRRIPAGATVRWHEHSAHWDEDDEPPPAVEHEPGSAHLIRRWTIELRREGTAIEVQGELRWVPGPSPWPLLAGTFVAGGLVLFAGWRPDRRLALGVALATLVGAQLVHLVGSWGASTSSPGDRLVASVYSLGALALAIAALLTLARRGVAAAAPLTLLAGLALALAGGLADVTALSRSQLPFTLSAWVDRVAVALTLGIGTAVAVLGARRLRLPTTVDPRSPDDHEDHAVPPAIQARYRTPS